MVVLLQLQLMIYSGYVDSILALKSSAKILRKGAFSKDILHCGASKNRRESKIEFRLLTAWLKDGKYHLAAKLPINFWSVKQRNSEKMWIF